MDFEKLQDWYDEHDTLVKMIASGIMLLVGLGLMGLGISYVDEHVGFTIFYFIIGIILSFLGIIPLGLKWIEWQGEE